MAGIAEHQAKSFVKECPSRLKIKELFRKFKSEPLGTLLTWEFAWLKAEHTVSEVDNRMGESTTASFKTAFRELAEARLANPELKKRLDDNINLRKANTRGSHGGVFGAKLTKKALNSDSTLRHNNQTRWLGKGEIAISWIDQLGPDEAAAVDNFVHDVVVQAAGEPAPLQYIESKLKPVFSGFICDALPGATSKRKRRAKTKNALGVTGSERAPDSVHKGSYHFLHALRALYFAVHETEPQVSHQSQLSMVKSIGEEKHCKLLSLLPGHRDLPWLCRTLDIGAMEFAARICLWQPEE